MDDKTKRLLALTDRILMHLEHQIPPEAVATQELRQLTDELMQQAGMRRTPWPAASTPR